MRLSLLTVLLLTSVHCLAAEIQRTDDAILLRNGLCTAEINPRGTAITSVSLGEGESLLTRASTSLYFAEGKHWVDEIWMKPTETHVRVEGDTAICEFETADFGGFRLRKIVALKDGAQVVQVGVELRANTPVKPQLICPACASTTGATDGLVTPAGSAAREDLKVSDFALELSQAWYAFEASAAGAGVLVRPVEWPQMHKVNWIGRKPNGSLLLATRLHPMREISEGETVRFAYNLAAYTGDAAQAAEQAAQAGKALDLAPWAAEEPPAPPQITDQTPGRDALPVAYCPTVSEAPATDGQLGDPAWRQAFEIDRFTGMSGADAPNAQTAVRIARDANALYLSLRCDEPFLEDLRTDAQPGSDKVWMDDCVEVFIDVDARTTEYGHFIVNAAGVTQDNLPGERAGKYEWSAATARGEGRWVAEMRIAFADLDCPRPADGDTWRVNFCRSRVTRREISCWSPTFGYFHVPERFGVLAFGSPRVKVGRIDPGLAAAGSDRFLILTARNDTDEPAAVHGAYTVSLDGAERPGAFTKRLAANATEVVRAHHSAPGSGLCTVAVTLGETPDTPTFRAAFTARIYSQGLNSTIYPAEEDDFRLYIARGTVQHFFFIPANHGEQNFDSLDFVLELPQGLQVMQASSDHVGTYFLPTLKSKESVERDGTSLTRWTWTSDRALGEMDIAKRRFFNSWCGALLPGEEVEPGEYPFHYYLRSGEESEKPHRGTLIVLPEPEGRQPKRIVVGMSGWTMAPTPEFWSHLMDTYRRCGINLVDCHAQARGEEYLQPLRGAGMRSFRLWWWHWWNDEYRKAHPEHAAVKLDGTADDKRLCPEILADPSTGALAGAMGGNIEAARKGAIEGTWWDLEGPACFEVCFCPRCIDAFRRQAGIEADEELTPIKIQARYTEQWVDFACGQSNRIAALMRQLARDAGVDWKLAVYSGTRGEHTRRAYRVDWDTLTSHIDIATPSFYSFSPSALSTTFASGVREVVGGYKAIRDIPVWTTISTGYGRGDNFVPDGRLTAMQIMKSVAYGADGVIQWWWGPVDGRHYHAYARATRTISELEEFFTEGKVNDDVLTGDDLPGTTRVAWVKGDELLVMLFNDRATEGVRLTADVAGGWQVLRTDEAGEMEFAEGKLSAEADALSSRWVVLGKGQ